jgi:tetratricopeptide (TPR) repeat protein
MVFPGEIMKSRLYFAAIAASALLSTHSHAACVYPPFEFHPEENGGVEVPVKVDAGSSCRHNFAEGPGYHFTGVTIDQKPLYGTLQQTGKNAFLYTPGPGAKDADVYTFNICATKGKQSGCSLIIFNVLGVQSSSDCGAGDPDRVISACNSLIGNASAESSDRARALKWRGLAYFSKGDRKQAIADFSDAIELNAADAESYSNRGLCYQWDNGLDQAMQDYNRAIEINPKLAAAFANRGHVYQMKADWKQAAADFDQALTLDPKLGATYFQRGLVRLQLGELDGALADLSKALEFAPQNAEIYAARGVVFHRKGDDGKALTDYDKAIQYAPQHSAGMSKYPGGYIRRGALFHGRGEYNRALSDYDEAIRILERTPGGGLQVYGDRGMAHLGSGDYTAAAADFTRLRDAKPPHPYAPLWLYIAEARRGNGNKSVLKELAAAPSWPGPLASFLLGAMTREDLERAASQGTETDRHGRSCEIAYYLGEQALADKRNDQAMTLIKQAAESCPGGFLERGAAISEWQRLQR